MTKIPKTRLLEMLSVFADLLRESSRKGSRADTITWVGETPTGPLAELAKLSLLIDRVVEDATGSLEKAKEGIRVWQGRARKKRL